ncbi:MAG TPA: M23 family metallopeptidase, partial [Ferruginibacter sp.]|nr:M23 family metallopeptidase [Ferruginibacter sp.]
MKIKSTIVAVLVLISYAAVAQTIPIPPYPKGYFQWPLHLTPGIAANFGELRPNHYHMGLDIRTDHKQNQQVFAAAEGYIARVKIEPQGFGRSIYINHPNGLTTVYAHLNDFNPELEKYVTDQQYQLKSWRVFLDIPPDLFPVKKDQFIAYSGNTGGSQGPHLHFEIRDTKTDKVLNPLLFGMPINDNIPPDIYKLAVYNRNSSVFDESPKIYAVKKVNGVYIVPALIRTVASKISFAIMAFDRYENSGGRNGIFQALLFDSTKPIAGFQLDSISYNETRDCNAHIDYRIRSKGGGWLEHVSRLPGYVVSPYHLINGDGAVYISDDSIHKMHIDVSDAYGNTSVMQFQIQRGPMIQGSTSYVWAGTNAFFFPNKENKFETEDFIIELPENCVYDVIHSSFSSEGAPPFKTYTINASDIPVHGYFTVKIKADIPAESQNKVVMMCAGRGT